MSSEFDERVLFSPPELTDYLFDDDVEYELALEQNYQLQNNLPAFSQRFSSTIFVYVEIDCVGGTCLHSGYCCGAGVIQFAVNEVADNGHVELLQRVGINTHGPFSPFQRGFFAGLGSGGFK